MFLEQKKTYLDYVSTMRNLSPGFDIKEIRLPRAPMIMRLWPD